MHNFRKYFESFSPWKNRSTSRHDYPPVFLTQEVVDATSLLVSSFGTPEEPHEGIVYWAGLRTSSAWAVTTVLAPEALTTWGSYHTRVGANAYIVRAINELKLQMLAQVHGHPTDWVNHSEGDDSGAFMPYEGFYSIILPWYGQRSMIPLDTCGIHRFEDGLFYRLTNDEVRRKFIVVPAAIDLRKVLSRHGK